jgi:hypothetical protein
MLTFLSLGYNLVATCLNDTKARVLSANFKPLNMSNKIVTVSRVKSPWYAAGFLLRAGFRKSIPTYQKLPGLEFKYYAMKDKGKSFGGIYLWDSLENAVKQFAPFWYSEVQRKYKTDGVVEYYPLISEHSYLPPNSNLQDLERSTVTIFIPDLTSTEAERLASASKDLFRAYVVISGTKEAIFLLFANLTAATKFIKLKKVGKSELFYTPVLLNNQSE